MTRNGKHRENFVLYPVSGKAIPVYKGEMLRLVQEVGGQCVDFNCFNLHDYKERMSVGQMRRQGFRLGKGDYVISAPPRSNLMMRILEMPPTCVTDLLGARCSADFFEATWGFDIHTNCQDTLAEAIGAYGLTPDDTHDSFNLWMNTGWNDQGRWVIRRNPGRKGDVVDLLALMDILAVPVVCGAGDLSPVSNFSLKPIRVQVFGSSPATEALVEEQLRRYGRYRNQRVPRQFRVRAIRRKRELTRDPEYTPEFVNYPLGMQAVDVKLTREDEEQIRRLQEYGLAVDAEDAIRSGVVTWFLKNRANLSPLGMREYVG